MSTMFFGFQDHNLRINSLNMCDIIDTIYSIIDGAQCENTQPKLLHGTG